VVAWSYAREGLLKFKTCHVTGELPGKTFMRWGREKQNAVSWLGESDLVGFQRYFEQHGETPGLLLQSLSRRTTGRAHRTRP
jgi:hypothetical protein